jgi:hypothetical protein
MVSILVTLVLVLLGSQSLSLLWRNQEKESVFETLTGLVALTLILFVPIAILSTILRRIGFGRAYRKPVTYQHSGKITGAAFAFAMLCMAVSMIPATNLAVKKAKYRSDAERALSEPWRIHSFNNGEFSLRVPSNWQADATNDNFLEEKHNGIGLTITATRKVDVNVKTFDELREAILSNVKLRGATIKTTEKSPIGCLIDRQFQDLHIKGHLQTENFELLVRQIDFPDHWVTAEFVSRPSAFDENRETMQNMADTIWLKDKKNYVLETYAGQFHQEHVGHPITMRMFILRSDAPGKIDGVINWPDLGYAATGFKGEWSGQRFKAEEFEVLAGGNRVVVPVYYRGQLDGKMLTGTATYKDTLSEFRLEKLED